MILLFSCDDIFYKFTKPLFWSDYGKSKCKQMVLVSKTKTSVIAFSECTIKWSSPIKNEDNIDMIIIVSSTVNMAVFNYSHRKNQKPSY